MEKNCVKCKKSHHNTEDGSWCVLFCDDNYSGFEPIEPQPQAAEYEILKDITLRRLVLNTIFPRSILVWIAYHHPYGVDNCKKLNDLITAYQESEKLLIENKYIKKKERKPKVGEIWINPKGFYKIIETQGYFSLGHNVTKYYYGTAAIDRNRHTWKFFCNSEELISHLNTIKT